MQKQPTRGPGPMPGEPTIAQARQLAQAGDAIGAEHCYRRILEREPWQVEALYRLALLLQQDNRHDEALHQLGNALAAQPDNPLLHVAQASSLAATRNVLDALESMACAVCLRPEDAGLLYNTGLLCAELCCPTMAEVIARRLLRDQPDWPAAHFLLVRALTGREADPGLIAAEYDLLLKSDPLNPALRFARGLQQLREGNYRDGWEAHEWRWEIEPVKSSRCMTDRPRWTGGPLAGRRLLILGEQGHGDILQFSRYLPLLIRQGAQVTLRLDRERAGLARLLRRFEGLELTLTLEALPPHDLYCPLASLPWICGTMADGVPPPARPELDGADVAAWRSRLSALPRPWIGVCWAGSAEHSHDLRRSLPLAADGENRLLRQRHDQRIGTVAAAIAQACGLAAMNAAAELDALARAPSLQPLLERCAGSLVSLQLGPPAAELDGLAAALRARFTMPLNEGNDFYDSACLLTSLDAVISVDTAVAHLAGTIGCPVTVIKPAAPEWRWMQRDGFAIWYPCMRLVSQDQLAACPGEIAGWAAASASANPRTSASPGHPTQIDLSFRPEYT